MSENGCNTAAATALMPAAVNVTGTRTVVPTKKSCALTTFDLPYITAYYNQKLLIYRTPTDSVPGAVARMMAALADALQVFYPLTGRIRQDEDGVLAIEGDEQGAEVLEVETDAISIDDLVGGDYNNEVVEGVVKKLVPYTGVMNLEGLRRPLLAVQVS